MYLPIIQYDMVINSRGVMIKMGIYNIKNAAGIKQVHYMYLRCPDWAIVGTTQSEIALSFPGFIWKNICQLPFYNFSVTAVLLERKKIWETVSLLGQVRRLRRLLTTIISWVRRDKVLSPGFNVKIVLLSRATGSVSSGNLSAFDVISSKRAKQHTSTGRGRLSLFKIWRAFMVGDARLLILLPLETRQVAPDNTVVLTLKNLVTKLSPALLNW